MHLFGSAETFARDEKDKEWLQTIPENNSQFYAVIFFEHRCAASTTELFSDLLKTGIKTLTKVKVSVTNKYYSTELCLLSAL